ncbi:MAG: hypothetical protein WAK31_07710 [Chthoniobacterales bacterium]
MQGDEKAEANYLSSVIFIRCCETLAEKAGKAVSMKNFIACGNGFEIRSQTLAGAVHRPGKFEMKLFKMVQVAAVLLITSPVLAGGTGTEGASIMPGASLAGVSLGPNGTPELGKLGKPYRIDRGMSQTHQVWKWFRPGGRFDTFFVHTVNNGAIDAQPADGVTIDLIRSTATRFRTANGIAVGSTLNQIRKSFPAVAPPADTPTIFDDVKAGIAFEFSAAPGGDSPCIAIMVHPPGQSNIATQEQVAEVLENGNTD